jgi:hypothetical protein
MNLSGACLITGIATAVVASTLASSPDRSAKGSSYEEVVKFVGERSKLILLSEGSGASIAVWPAMQGRVLTSSAEGPQGRSFGWYNRELIASGRAQEHINAVGGEDRLWLGPEGGQFSIFFATGAPFDLDHWYTPAPIDTKSFDVVGQTSRSVTFRKSFGLTNYSGTRFKVQIDREVRLLSTNEVWSRLGFAPQRDVKVVGFESDNRLTNTSAKPWSKASGVLSLWVLGQFQSTPQTSIVLPIHPGSTAELGVPVTTDYFGPVPKDRISVTPRAVLFKADSHYRGKLGLSQQRAKGVLGSYDAENHVLTILQYSQPAEPADYVNSAWKIQKDPYRGDVANCYNDGPPAPGKPQLGHFYELESSSPAVTLKSHQSVKHTQRTIHLVGSEEKLDAIAQAVLGVSLRSIHTFNH